MATMAVGFLALANAQIRAAEQQHVIQKRERLLRYRLIALIDELITDVEDLNLESVSRVPGSYENRLVALRAILSHAAIPSNQLGSLRTRIGVIKLMDQLYAVQETVFATLWSHRDPMTTARPGPVCIRSRPN